MLSFIVQFISSILIGAFWTPLRSIMRESRSFTRVRVAQVRRKWRITWQFKWIVVARPRCLVLRDWVEM